jgi:hypothetical protein
MRLTVAAKKIGDKWEGALVSEGKFQRAIVTDDGLDEVVLRGLFALLSLNYPEGTNVVIEAVVETPGNPGTPT